MKQRITVKHDEDPQNPRTDWDNHADVIYCRHPRYDLGDKDAEDPMYEAAFVTLTSPSGTEYVLDDDNNDYEMNLCHGDIEAMLEAHAEEASNDSLDLDSDDLAYPQSLIDATRAADGYEYIREAAEYKRWESEHRERKDLDIAICRPLFLYDHSGITISAGSFSCQWDSGQVGWQYVTAASLETEWKGDEAKARAYMDATLETYDYYIRGSVYGFVIEEGIPSETTYADGREPTTSIEWEETDSCWGFFGYDPIENGMADHVPNELHEAMKKAAHNEGEPYEA